MQPTRATLGPFDNPVRGLLHGSGAALWIAFAATLAARPASAERTALLLGAASQAALFATSALYHSLPWPPRWKARMQRADHAMIHVKIAGTLTAIVWLAGPLPFGASLLAAGWLTTLGAVAWKTLGPRIPEAPDIRLQLAQTVVLGVPAITAFAAREPSAHALLLIGGGLLYLAGGLCFAARRPVLWPRVFSFHEVFHVFVLAGSGAHLWLFARILARVP
jgi:hemolysin III